MTFASQMRAFTNKAEGAVDKTVKSITFALFREVVGRTPVDTGRLKGAWAVSVGAASFVDYGRHDVTPKGKIDAASQWHILNNMGGLGSITYMSNPMPYAERIEFDGWSHTKAPEGMVRVSFARIDSIVRSVARQNKV